MVVGRQLVWFSRGRPDTREMDLWRVLADGGAPERMTRRTSDIAYPTPIDTRTVLYIAHDENGAGPWLWALDIATRESRRVSLGVEQYSSPASVNGRRVVASLVSAQVNLWSVPLLNRAADERAVKRFPLPSPRALTPRFGGGTLFYLSSRGGADGLWSYRNGQATEIWKGSEGALHSPPAVSPDGHRIAIALRRNGKMLLNVLSAERVAGGAQLHPLAQNIDIRGAQSWSPDGKWIVAAGVGTEGPGLFKIPADGAPPVRIASGNALDPVWSPEGDDCVSGNEHIHPCASAWHSSGRNTGGPSAPQRAAGRRARPFSPGRKGAGLHAGHRRPTAHFIQTEREGNSLQATALVHELYLRLIEVESVAENRARFFALCAQIMRRILVDAARARFALKRGGGQDRIDLDELPELSSQRDKQLISMTNSII